MSGVGILDIAANYALLVTYCICVVFVSSWFGWFRTLLVALGIGVLIGLASHVGLRSGHGLGQITRDVTISASAFIIVAAFTLGLFALARRVLALVR